MGPTKRIFYISVTGLWPCWGTAFKDFVKQIVRSAFFVVESLIIKAGIGELLKNKYIPILFNYLPLAIWF